MLVKRKEIKNNLGADKIEVCRNEYYASSWSLLSWLLGGKRLRRRLGNFLWLGPSERYKYGPSERYKYFFEFSDKEQRKTGTLLVKANGKNKSQWL